MHYELKINNSEIIHLVNRVAEEVTSQEIFNFCLKFLETHNNSILIDCFYNQGEQLLIRKKVILGSLKITTILPLRDSKENCYIFYDNLFLKISSEEIKNCTYSETSDIEGFIWKQNIINRLFLKNDETSVIELFFRKVTNNEMHFKSLQLAIGYSIHRYKDPSLTKVIIVSDENTEAENQPNGGTGKGIFLKSIGQIVNVVTQNGKNLDLSNNRFAYQNVSVNTDILFLDDVKKGFSFEQLFTIATNDMTVEYKNKPSFTIPFELSPRIIITTNYNIGGTSSSHKRRKFTIFFNNYFSDIHTPFQEFRQLFFTKDWDEIEWNKFDTFMMNCVRLFLKEGLVEYESNNELKLKQLKAAIDDDVFYNLETKCNELGKFYSLKELGLSNLKLVRIYSEYKNYAFSHKQVNGCTMFKFCIQNTL